LDLRDPAQKEFQFDFAFGTDDLPRPNIFLDSLSAVLQAASDPLLSATLFVIDGAAEVYAPSGVGALMFNPLAVVREEIAPFSFGRQFKTEKAYRVRAAVPEPLLGSTAMFYLDLFDNGDSAHSAAWFGNLVVVPEPKPVLIWAAGLALFFLSRKRS
jgi:hypothetical protein